MNEEQFKELIVWNVGQGLWVTLLDGGKCIHFDMGGEKSPIQAVLKICGSRENESYFSHWDQDHISFAKRFSSRVHSYCVRAWPAGTPSEKKARDFSRFSNCANSPPPTIDEIKQRPAPVTQNSGANERSRVFVALNRILLPGDSTSTAENRWIPNLTQIQSRHIRLLILGHHGSRTSTSDRLLSQLPRLQMAIASARMKKYGHPHGETVARLKAHQISVLSTENWGHIRFILAPERN